MTADPLETLQGSCAGYLELAPAIVLVAWQALLKEGCESATHAGSSAWARPSELGGQAAQVLQKLPPRSTSQVGLLQETGAIQKIN